MTGTPGVRSSLCMQARDPDCQYRKPLNRSDVSEGTP